MALSAPAVSAKLKAAGFGIVTTRNREGIRVSRGALPGRVCVAVDLDRPGEARRTAVLLEEWLTSNADALGWAWTKHSGEAGLYTLTHKALTPPAADPLGPVYVAQKPLQPPVEHTPRRDQARALRLELRNAMLDLEHDAAEGNRTAQANVTAARTALEALIKLAGGAQ